MAQLALSPPHPIAPGIWRYDIPGTGVRYAYLQGERYDIADGVTTFDAQRMDGWFPSIEAFDSLDDVPQQREHDGRINLTFFENPDRTAVAFRVERKVSGEWQIIGWIAPEDTAGYRPGWYKWTTEWLADVTVYEHRIVPMLDSEHDGTPVEFRAEVVRNPDAPDISLSYSAVTGLLTIS